MFFYNLMKTISVTFYFSDLLENSTQILQTPLDLSSLDDTQPCHSHSHSDENESSGISSYSQNEKSDDSENIEGWSKQ